MKLNFSDVSFEQSRGKCVLQGTVTRRRVAQMHMCESTGYMIWHFVSLRMVLLPVQAFKGQGRKAIIQMEFRVLCHIEIFYRPDDRQLVRTLVQVKCSIKSIQRLLNGTPLYLDSRCACGSVPRTASRL